MGALEASFPKQSHRAREDIVAIIFLLSSHKINYTSS
jgi:hypothetical protein